MPRPARLTPPTSPGSAPPACTGASPCFPEKQAARQAGPSHVQGPPQPIPTPEPMRACRASLHISGARPRPTGRPHEAPHAPIAKRAARNISPYHGQVCDTADTTGWSSRSSSPERSPLAGTEEPAPQGELETRAQKASAGSYLYYFVAAWRRAMLALMHSTMPTARTPTIAVTQAAKSPKCRAGIPMSRPTT